LIFRASRTEMIFGSHSNTTTLASTRSERKPQDRYRHNYIRSFHPQTF
jgi:uncharacterized protein YnzC (UPF0291/DUF896 family)